MTHALEQQHGGAHYKGLAIQPVEFAQRNRWDFCTSSCLKYLSRWRRKGGVEDLQKGRHFIEMREEIGRPMSRHSLPHAHYTINEYVKSNGIEGLDADAIIALDDYVLWPNNSSGLPTLYRAIDALIALARE